MSALLYEELGLQKDALPEHIRKAYKKKALLTHPDRLPPNATPEQKSASEEMFRKVNNAYEVLSDPAKRKEYDIHGVWPPPENLDNFADMRSSSSGSRAHRSSRTRSFDDDPSFRQHHHHSSFTAFHFTDPFTLFESMFGGSQSNPRSSRDNIFRSQSMDPFGSMFRMESDIEQFMDNMDSDPLGFGGFPSSFGRMPSMSMFPPIATGASSFGSSRGGWTSESYSTRMINGVTETIHSKVDSQGNEHITRTLADGQQLRFLNGVEQPQQRRLESSSGRYPPSPTSYQSRSRHSSSRGEFLQSAQMPSYSGPPQVYRADTPPAINPHHQDRVHRRGSSRSKYSYHSSHSNPDRHSHENRHHHHLQHHHRHSPHETYTQGGQW